MDKFTTANIRQTQWDEFSAFIVQSWNLGFSPETGHEQKFVSNSEDSHLFIKKFVLNHDRSKLNKSAKLWIRVFRDCFAEALGLDQAGDELGFIDFPIATKWSKFRDSVAGAIELFTQHMHRLLEEASSNDGNNADNINLDEIGLVSKMQFSSLHKEITPIFVLHVGRLLGFRSQPASESWIYAGRLYIMYFISCNLYGELSRRIGPFIEEVEEDDDRQQQDEGGRQQPESDEQNLGDGGVAKEWRSGTVSAILLKLCVVKVWAEKYENNNKRQPYCQTSMLGEWLNEGIALFNNTVQQQHSWNEASDVKKYPQSLVKDIRKTAELTWLKSMVSSKNLCIDNINGESKPTTNWMADWIAKPIGKNREKWEIYFSFVIARAKCSLTQTGRINNKKRIGEEEISGRSNNEEDTTVTIHDDDPTLSLSLSHTTQVRNNKRKKLNDSAVARKENKHNNGSSSLASSNNNDNNTRSNFFEQIMKMPGHISASFEEMKKADEELKQTIENLEEREKTRDEREKVRDKRIEGLYATLQDTLKVVQNQQLMMSQMMVNNSHPLNYGGVFHTLPSTTSSSSSSFLPSSAAFVASTTTAGNNRLLLSASSSSNSSSSTPASSGLVFSTPLFPSNATGDDRMSG